MAATPYVIGWPWAGGGGEDVEAWGDADSAPACGFKIPYHRPIISSPRHTTISLSQQRARVLNKNIGGLDGEIKEASLELTAFEQLREHEQAAIPVRREALAEEVAVQERRQSALQQRYKELTQRLQAAQ